MRKRLNTRGIFWRQSGLGGLLLAALLLLACSACGTPPPPRATIYASSQDGSNNGIVVYALNAQNGTVRWQVKINDIPTPPEQPVIVNTTLYLVAWRSDARASFVTVVYALRIQDGSVLWRYQTSGYYSAKGLTVAGGLVYLALGGAASHPLLALDAATGAVRWQAHLPGTSYGAPAVAGGLVITSSSDGFIYALREATGTLAWSYPLATTNEAPALTATGDLVYVGGAAGSVVALRTNDGALRWQVHLEHVPFTPVVAQGVLYAVPDEGSHPLYALRPGDGSTIWQYQSNEYGCTGGVSITVADQVVYCGADSPYLALLDAGSGLLVQHYTIPINLISSYPVVVGPGE